MRKPEKVSDKKLSNSVYMSNELRLYLEKLVIDAAFHRGRGITASIFVQNLITDYGEKMRDKLIAEGQKGVSDESNNK